MGDFYITDPGGPFHTGIGAAFNTFTARQNVSPVPIPVVPAYRVRLGAKLKIEAEGEFSTTGTPTLSIGVWFGTLPSTITGQWEYTAAATGSAAAAWPWRLEWRGLVTGTLGTTATIVGMGSVELGSSLVATTTLPIPSTAATRTLATYDSTIARAWGICATWGTSSASNSITTYNLSFLYLN